MIIVENIKQLTAARSNIKGTVALVATMGNLHQGHLSLVERAKSEADNVIVTIYVNPMQFSVNEDLATYPRTLDNDSDKLKELDVDILFTPTDAVMYPEGIEVHTQVEVPSISYMYCGAHRAGHFRGVTTVVCKLFNLIRPDVAIFGNKDFQQLTILQKMVTDLAMPVKLIGMPTYREDSGLAMSSRNRNLSTEDKQLAASLYQTLQWTAKQLQAQDSDFRAIEELAKSRLADDKFRIEFFTICNRENLAPAEKHDKQLVILSAIKFAKPRLIDNITIDLGALEQ
jgi:pantoate--beta-alanine ligase